MARESEDKKVKEFTRRVKKMKKHVEALRGLSKDPDDNVEFDRLTGALERLQRPDPAEAGVAG